MDVSSIKSDNSEEWQNISKSDFEEVIFTDLYWNSECEEVGCNFELTEAVCRNTADNIGFYKVGYNDLSQCIAKKDVEQLTFKGKEKASCVFKSEELPELLDGYFQFLYVSYDGEVLGSSMSIAVNKSKPEMSCNDVVTEKVEDDAFCCDGEVLGSSMPIAVNEGKPEMSCNAVVTEKVEDGILMVRFGLEQQNNMLVNEINNAKEEKIIASCKFDSLLEDLEKGKQMQKRLYRNQEKYDISTSCAMELEDYNKLNIELLSLHEIFEQSLMEEIEKTSQLTTVMNRVVLENNTLMHKLNIVEENTKKKYEALNEEFLSLQAMHEKALETNLKTVQELEIMQNMVAILTEDKSQHIKVEEELGDSKTENILLKVNLKAMRKLEEFKKETDIADEEVRKIMKENKMPQLSENYRSTITDFISEVSSNIYEQDMSPEELRSRNKVLKNYCKRWERKTDILKKKCNLFKEKLEDKSNKEASLKAKIEALQKEKSTIENKLKEQIKKLEAEKVDIDESKMSVAFCESISIEDFPQSSSCTAPSEDETVTEVSPLNNDYDTGENVAAQIPMAVTEQETYN